MKMRVVYELGLESAFFTDKLMPFVIEKIQKDLRSCRQGRRLEIAHRETASDSFRLDFRRVSNHLTQKRPGYYLILLRTEIKHRSLREKPALIN
jgi:hypothetical protein